MNDNIVIISIDHSNKVSVDSITNGESNVTPAPSALNIGVISDNSFSFIVMSVRLFLATKHSPCQTLSYSDCYTAASPGSCFVSAGLS